MKNKFAFVLAGLLAISSAAFAADGRDHGYRGGDYRSGGVYHENYRNDNRGAYRDYGYRGGGGGVYLGVGPSYYSGYVAPAPYVDPYAYAAPAPYADEYVGPPPFAGAIWIGGGWTYGPHGRYFVRGHWGRR
jgi:hypothetical protein